MGDETAFHWHADARVHAPDGTVHGRDAMAPAPSGVAPVFLLETPPAPALIRAMAIAEAGGEFCLCRTLPDDPGTPADGPALQCMSSGTSGAPRRIRRSQATWLRSFAVDAGLWDITPADRIAVLGALGHSLTLYGAVQALQMGCDLDLLSGLRPDRQLARLAAGGATILYATPAQLVLLTEVAARRGLGPLPGLRLVLVGGARLDPGPRRAAAALCPGAAIREFYGASETSYIAMSDETTPEGAAGRAYPGVEIAIRDDEGAPLPAGETGEIWVRSPYLFSGYAAGPPGDTRWRDGFLTVGEYGRLDAAGHLYVAGRRGRMVTVADQNVFPEEVESFLQSLDGVIRAAVLPVADPRRGHVLTACVQTRPGTDAAALLAACRRGLGPLKAPRRITEVADWPVLASGKPDLRALSQRHAGPAA